MNKDHTAKNIELHFPAVQLGDLEKISCEILQTYSDYKVFTLSGNLGAGKTRLVQSLCKALKCSSKISSPTYAIVNDYEGENKTYHLDLYRLQSKQELMGIGFEEYIFSQAYCFIEWPELAFDLLSEYVHIKINVNKDLSRNISTLNER